MRAELPARAAALLKAPTRYADIAWGGCAPSPKDPAVTEAVPEPAAHHAADLAAPLTRRERRRAREDLLARHLRWARRWGAPLGIVAASGVLGAYCAAAVGLGAASAAEVTHGATALGDITPPIQAPGMAAAVTVVSVEEAIEPDSVTQSDNLTPVGYTRVVSEGTPGVVVTTYALTLVDGIEVDREPIATVITVQPVDDVVGVGTLEVPARPAITAGSNRDIGKRIAAEHGWTGIEWQCLDNLFERESNWRHTVSNPSSGAYGIPQALPASKMATVADDWKANPATQVEWGLRYIEQRYGSPCVAWGWWTLRSPHWY